MIKYTTTIGGILLVVVGLLGFSSPGLLGMHLSVPLNIAHLVSGAVALYFGLRSTPLAWARTCCLILGALYALLGLAGFVVAGPTNTLTILPGELVLGTMDHAFHLILGAGFLVAGRIQSLATARPRAH